MEIELEARLLKQIIQFADSLEVDRLPLVADADGLHIAAADSGQINAVKAKLCPITFGKYIPDAAPKHAEAGKAQVCYHDVDVIAEVLKLAESPASVIGIKTIPKNYEVISGEVTLGAVTRSYDVCQYPPYKPSEWVYEAMPSHARVHIVQKEFYNMVKIAADLGALNPEGKLPLLACWDTTSSRKLSRQKCLRRPGPAG
ncbi:MAG: hypothetical protein NTY99_00185 [DPANN group archaeon]|nr:hypothetical protein [DPANN group archaeon]